MNPAPTKQSVTPGKGAPDNLHVIDTNTSPDRITDAGVVFSGKRVHHMLVDGIVKPYVFEHGKPLPIEYAIAMRFLEADDAFKLTDETGKVLPHTRLPKQPHQLQAGETLKLSENETVARYVELTTEALARRAFQMAGGERFARSEDRAAIIAFIVDGKKAREVANISKESDAPKDDEFIPALGEVAA